MKLHECGATKVCSTCVNEKSITEYGRNWKSKDGYLNRCKSCNKEISSNLKNTNPEMYERSLERARQYKKGNKEQIDAVMSVWREENKGSVAVYNKAKYNANPELHRDRAKVYRQNNPEKVKQSHDKWVENNPVAYRALKNKGHAKRKAIRKNAMPVWADKKAIATFYTEASKRSASGTQYHVDHIIPLLGKNVCGLHVENNLQVITAEENIRKNNKFS